MCTQMDCHTLNWIILPIQLQAALIKDKPHAKFREKSEGDSEPTDILLASRNLHTLL